MKINNIKKSIVGGFLTIALLVSAIPANTAKAATVDELIAQIQSLILQIQARGGTVPGAATSNSCAVTFISDMTLGRSGAEVTALQNFLIKKGFAIPAGATGYFGGQTQTALAAFQRANGITPAVGYFGPLTRAKVNSMCIEITKQPSGTGSNSTSGSKDDSPSQTLKGEADFHRYDVKSGDQTNLKEGDKNQSIAEVEFEVRDGDLLVNRIDVAFTPDGGNDENDPWDVFEEVSIYNGNERVARMNTAKESSWREDQPNNGDYRLRFSGLSWLVKEDQEVSLDIRVTLHSNIKGANDGEVWTVFIPDNGIRATDADRVTIYTGDNADGVTIDIDEAGKDDEIIVKRSDEDPDASVLQLEDSRRSGWVKVFAFDLDTDDSDNDIEIRKIPINITVSSSTLANFMHDIRLVANGNVYNDSNITNGTTSQIIFDIDRDDFVIDGGDRVTVEVEVEFKALASNFEGTTIVSEVDTASIVAKGADTLSGSQLAGSATSETHTLRTQGVNISSQGKTATFKANSDLTKSDDQGSYSIEFKVTAFNSDIFVPKSASRGTTLGSSGVNYLIEDASLGGQETASGTASAVLTANADSQGSYYVVREGDTKTFKLIVSYDPEYESFYALQLHSINWSTTAVAPQTQQLVLPTSDYETDVVFISN